MKTRLIPVLLVVAIASSCSKTKTQTVTNTVVTTDTLTAVETPIKTTIAQGILVDTFELINEGPYEQGTVFYSSKNGTISQLGAIFPIGTYRVCLWDMSDSALLVAASVACTDTSKFAYAAISPIHITANHKYMVSSNTGTAGNYYSYGLKTFGSLAYPYSVGSITLVSYSYIAGLAAAFPTHTTDHTELVNSDIIFQADKTN